jgi:TPR repeat protein
MILLFILGCGSGPDEYYTSHRKGDLVVHAAEVHPGLDPVTVDLTRIDAESGGAEAQYELGQWYFEGEVMEQDYVKAHQWFLKAARQWHVGAMVYVGDMNVGGIGVPIDYGEALKWFKKAARRDSFEAQYHLGLMYEHGNGVKQSYGQALKWYRKSAAQNFARAQFHLGSMYLQGEGVDPDHVKAYQWFQLAREHGHVDAAQALISLTPKMSPAELSEAQAP